MDVGTLCAVASRMKFGVPSAVAKRRPLGKADLGASHVITWRMHDGNVATMEEALTGS